MTHSKRNHDELYKAMLALETEEECRKFFDDLFTIAELEAFSQRLTVAELLREKKTCQAISKETGASTATVTRVSKCLNYGEGGYALVLERLGK